MFYVYILYSSVFDKIYVGYSGNPELRLSYHNAPQNKGWTRRYQPWIILHQEVFATKQEAMHRERQLKTAKGRAFARSLLHTL